MFTGPMGGGLRRSSARGRSSTRAALIYPARAASIRGDRGRQSRPVTTRRVSLSGAQKLQFGRASNVLPGDIDGAISADTVSASWPGWDPEVISWIVKTLAATNSPMLPDADGRPLSAAIAASASFLIWTSAASRSSSSGTELRPPIRSSSESFQCAASLLGFQQDFQEALTV